jgi:hypothetical protein
MLGRRSAVLAGVAAVALSSGLVAAGSSGAAGAANAAKPKLYGWAQLSTGKVDTIGSIGLARFGSQLEAVWDEKVGSDATLATAEVTAAGREVFAAKRVLTPVWATINKDPQIFALGNERVIGFGGQYDANSGDPYSSHASASRSRRTGSATSAAARSPSRSRTPAWASRAQP